MPTSITLSFDRFGGSAIAGLILGTRSQKMPLMSPIINWECGARSACAPRESDAWYQSL